MLHLGVGDLVVDDQRASAGENHASDPDSTRRQLQTLHQHREEEPAQAGCLGRLGHTGSVCGAGHVPAPRQES